MRKKVIVVDEKDDIIGHKDIDVLKESDLYRVSALWVVNSKGEILLTRKPHRKKRRQSAWGPAVASMVEEDETYLSNLIKNAEQDLGLNDFEPNKLEKRRIRGEDHFFCQWYITLVDRDISDLWTNKKDIHAARWFTKEEILKEVAANPQDFHEAMPACLDVFMNKPGN